VLEHEGEVQGAVNAGFYALAAGSNAGVFHDVTVASSGVSSCITATPSMCNNSTPGPTELTGGQAGFAVGSGYDLATGLGSVDAAMLVASWPNQGEVSVAVSPGSASVVAGGSATLAVEVTGFLPNPALSCAGLPAAATCAFDGSGSGIALTVSTTAAAGSNAVAAGRLDPWSMLGLFAIGLAALLAASRRARRGHRPRVLAAALLAMAGAAATASCNSSHGDAHVDAAPDAAVTVPGNYTVTVSSTLGLATASTTFDLTITP